MTTAKEEVTSADSESVSEAGTTSALPGEIVADWKCTHPASVEIGKYCQRSERNVIVSNGFVLLAVRHEPADPQRSSCASLECV